MSRRFALAFLITCLGCLSPLGATDEPTEATAPVPTEAPATNAGSESVPANDAAAAEPGPSATIPLPARYAEATVETAKTSIYIGKVTLRMPPFQRVEGRYESTYSAKVFPFFFYNEAGRIAIELSADELRQLERGERVYFTGEAFSEKDEPRRVEGHAAPADGQSGKIKVRVWVSKNIELIFNTTYEFTGSE